MKQCSVSDSDSTRIAKVSTETGIEEMANDPDATVVGQPGEEEKQLCSGNGMRNEAPQPEEVFGNKTLLWETGARGETPIFFTASGNLLKRFGAHKRTILCFAISIIISVAGTASVCKWLAMNTTDPISEANWTAESDYGDCQCSSLGQLIGNRHVWEDGGVLESYEVEYSYESEMTGSGRLKDAVEAVLNGHLDEAAKLYEGLARRFPEEKSFELSLRILKNRKRVEK